MNYEPILEKARVLAQTDPRIPGYLRLAGDFFYIRDTDELALWWNPEIKHTVQQAIDNGNEHRTFEEIVDLIFVPVVRDSVQAALVTTYDQRSKNLLAAIIVKMAREGKML